VADPGFANGGRARLSVRMKVLRGSGVERGCPPPHCERGQWVSDMHSGIFSTLDLKRSTSQYRDVVIVMMMLN